MDFQINDQHVVPGWKVCANCHVRVKEYLEGPKESTEEDISTEDEGVEFEQKAPEQRALLNESFGIIGISPLKTHALPHSSKVKDAHERINRSQEKQKQLVKELFQLPEDSNQEVIDKKLAEKETEAKAKNFDRLMFLLKEKTTDKGVPTREKIQALTMAPLDWSRERE